jgi:hypothetical protein
MVLPVALPSSSPHCHETDAPGGKISPTERSHRQKFGNAPARVRRAVRECPPPDASRTDAEVGPVLVQCPVRSPRDQPFATLVGATSSADRHTHRLGSTWLSARLTALELLCGTTDANIGGAGSTRWIALLGRACRRHRQLLSTRGNGVIRYLTGSSICPLVAHVNPSRTGHSRTTWSPGRGRRHSSASGAHPWVEPPATS